MELRDRILAKKDLPTEVINIKEWGVDVLIISLTASERGKTFEGVIDEEGIVSQDNLYFNMVVICACDPKTKKPIFEASDVEALKKKNGGAIEQIARKAFALNGIGEEAAKRAEKNSSPGILKEDSISA